jgi:hypothetical protein
MQKTNVLILAVVITVFFGRVGFAAGRNLVVDVNPKTEEVSLTYDRNTRWAPNDSLCAFVQTRKLFCGLVIRATPAKIDVRIDQKETVVAKGTWVTLRLVARKVASETTTSVVDESNRDNKPFDVSLGLSAGFNYYFPMAQLQVALDREFSLGIEPLYVNYSEGSANVVAFGGFLTAAYYITHFPFRGFFLEGGLGLYDINASVSGNSDVHVQGAFKATMNWRGRAAWELGLDIGVGVGFQYIIPVDRSFTSAFSGVLPLFQVVIGYPF